MSSYRGDFGSKSAMNFRKEIAPWSGLGKIRSNHPIENQHNSELLIATLELGKMIDAARILRSFISRKSLFYEATG